MIIDRHSYPIRKSRAKGGLSEKRCGRRNLEEIPTYMFLMFGGLRGFKTLDPIK